MATPEQQYEAFKRGYANINLPGSQQFIDPATGRPYDTMPAGWTSFAGGGNTSAPSIYDIADPVSNAFPAASGTGSRLGASGASPTTAPTGSSSDSFASFLMDGAQIPSGSAVKSITSQTVLPDWYTNYAMDMLAGQKAISARPYETFQGPRVAGFTPEQEAGFNRTQAAAGAYQYPLQRATNVTSEFMGKSTLPAAQPYFSGALNLNPLTAASQDYGAARGMVNASQGYDSVAAASPYYSSAAGMNPLSYADPSFGAAEGMIGQSQGYNPVGAATPYFGQAAGMSGVNAATPYYGQAAGMSALGSAQPYLGAGADYAMQSAQGSGLDAAMPWLNAASGNVADVTEYMNPYQDAVVNRIADLGARNLRDVLMPSIEGRYIGAGQFGGSGQMTDNARAVRDISADVLAQQAALMNQGYVQAQQFKQGDLGRYGQLGATAGGLMGQDMTTRLGAGRTLADIGATAGNLTAQQQQLLASMGTNLGNLTRGQQDVLASMGVNLGNLTAGQQRSALDAANAYGDIGAQRGALAQGQQRTLTDIGTNLGSLTQGKQAGALDAARVAESLGTSTAGLTADQQKFLADLGISTSNIMGADINRTQAGAAQLADMAARAQELGLTGGAAVTGVGDRKQALNQGNLSVAYEDFLRQQGYPQQQLDAMLATFKGVAPGVPTGSLESGIVPSGVPATYKPGTAATIASGLTGLAGLADVFGNL